MPWLPITVQIGALAAIFRGATVIAA